MKTVTYLQIKRLAAHLAQRTDDASTDGVKMSTGEAISLRAFLAEELKEMWNREAWPELCDNLEQITLDATNAFDKRVGDDDEIGDILGIFDNADPRISTATTKLSSDRITEGDERVIVMPSSSGSTALWVDWQLPAPDLLDEDLDEAAALNAYTIPERFKKPLGYLGAAHLLTAEDPVLASSYISLAETALVRQANRITRPWWRLTGGTT